MAKANQVLIYTIDVSKRHDLQYWTKAFSCTEAELLAAVATVGNLADDVRRQLGLDKNGQPLRP